LAVDGLPGYRLADVADWRHWEDEVVVYDDRSGDTHRLGGLNAAVFLALQREPATVEQLRLMTDDPMQLDEVIVRLVGIGLVEATP
jgi:PqqD family protein of HPr-rel-A system